MGWLRHAIVDLGIGALIVLFVWQDWRWAEIFLWVYTPLIILLKIVALNAGSIAKIQESRRDVPPAFFHVLYFGYVVVLGAGEYIVLAALWAVVWALSAWEEHWHTG